jgi:hypothetical protein
MSDEIKNEPKLSEDESKQVAAGKPAAKELSPEDLSKVAGGASDYYLQIGAITRER